MKQGNIHFKACGRTCKKLRILHNRPLHQLITWSTFFCISWSHDQLSVNTKTVRFWKILLARAELRAYYNKVIFKFSESQKKWLQWLPKIRLDLYEKNMFCHLVMLELFSIQILVNFEIFKLLWNSSLSIMGLKSPFNS